MWCPAAGAGHVAVRARGRGARPQLIAAFRSCRTPLASAGIGTEPMDPFRRAAPWCRMCSWSGGT